MRYERKNSRDWVGEEKLEIEPKDEKIVIVGTAHVSPKSIEEVEKTIEELKPEAVAVELDYRRLLALQGKKQEIPIIDVVKRGEAHLLLFQILGHEPAPDPADGVPSG